MYRPGSYTTISNSSYSTPVISSQHEYSLQNRTTDLTQHSKNNLIGSLKMVPKINQIVNSVYAMNHAEMQSQLVTCSKIVRELLQNDCINMATTNALVLMITEQESAGSFRMDKIEEGLLLNKDLRLTASVRNSLSAINQVLENIIWEQSRNPSNRNKRSQHNIPDIHHHYLQFKALLDEFDQSLQEESNKKRIQQSTAKKYSRLSPDTLKAHEQQSKQKQQEYEALIEQLEDIVAKKQRRIKEMTEELQEHIIDQKNIEDVVEELQNRNYQMSQEIKDLHFRISQSDKSQLELREKLNELQHRNLVLLQNQESNAKINARRNASTEKSIKTKFTIEEPSIDLQNKKDRTVRDLLFENYEISSSQKQSKRQEASDFQALSRMLYAQAVSIEALI